jgi:hypothetical protein
LFVFGKSLFFFPFIQEEEDASEKKKKTLKE